MPSFKLETEEILKLLNETNIVNSNNLNADVLLFTTHFGLTEGNYKIHKELLYTLYNKWSKDPIIRKTFFILLSRYLSSYKKNHYFINKSHLKISKALLTELKAVKRPLATNTHYTKHHFESFLKYYLLDKGKTPVNYQDVYKLYRSWSYYKGKRRFSEEKFKAILKLYIPYTRTKEGIRYLMSDNIINILEQERLLSEKKEEKNNEK